MGRVSNLRRIRPSGSGAKIDFDKNYDSGPTGPPDSQIAGDRKSHSRLPGRLTRDNEIPGHDIPPVRAGRAGTEIFIKINFWTGTGWANSLSKTAHAPPILKNLFFEN